MADAANACVKLSESDTLIKKGIPVPEISRDEVAHLARLARLALTAEELDQFADQIDGIIAHVSAVGRSQLKGWSR